MVLKHIDLPPKIIRLTFVTFILRKLVGRGWVRLIALWSLGGPVLQMGGGSAEAGVTPKAGGRPQGLRPDQTEKQDSQPGEGWLAWKLPPLGPWASRET